MDPKIKNWLDSLPKVIKPWVTEDVIAVHGDKSFVSKSQLKNRKAPPIHAKMWWDAGENEGSVFLKGLNGHEFRVEKTSKGTYRWRDMNLTAKYNEDHSFEWEQVPYKGKTPCAKTHMYKGEEYPVHSGTKGGCFIFVTPKSGKSYRKYLK